MFGRDVQHPPWSWRKRIFALLSMTAALGLGLALLITDAAPRVPKLPPPTAEQVGAVRAAAQQFRSVRARSGKSPIRFQTAELTALAAMASNAFDPDRLMVEKRRGSITVTGSRNLPLGRWLNVAVSTRGGGTGFPPANVRIGSLALPQSASRWVFRLARRVAISRGVMLAPLDQMVRHVAIRPGSVSAFVSLPVGNDAFSSLGSSQARATTLLVRNAYCRLARLQTRHPSEDFALHVRRAFAPDRSAVTDPATNRAYIFALAMLTVDVKVGELIDVTSAALKPCVVAPAAVLLHGRADLPKHWALSAALAAATGTQFSQAMGEWKELADTLSRQSQFAVGDPTGFSFVDLAADRSGYLIAGAAIDRTTAGPVAARLGKAEQEDLLPRALLQLPESISNKAFTQRFGDTRDSRFLAATAQVDAKLRQSAKARSGPLTLSPTP